MKTRRLPFISLNASAICAAMLAVVFLIAGAALIARILHAGTLPVIESDLSWMRGVTAVCLLLCGGTLAFLRGGAEQRMKGRIARTAGIVLGVFGLLTLASYLFEIFAGHEPPMAHWPVCFFMVNPSRMSIITAVHFSLFGGVLILLGNFSRRAATAAHTALLPIALMTYLVIIGYLFEIHTLYEWLYPGIALDTAIAFIALSLAAFALRPDSRLAEVFSGDEAGAVMARRLAPAIVILPLVIGWLRIQGERHGLFSSEVGVAIVACTYSVFFLAFVWFNAQSVNRADRKRRLAVVELRKSEAAIRLKLNSILTPEGDIGDLELADIIDAPGIQKLMDNFNELVGIPMAIIDLKGAVLVGTGWQEICTCFHRVNPDSCRNCIESDTELSKEIPAGEFKLYKCRNHMWDMATPIVVGGKKMGNLFMGQFFFEEDAIDYDLFRGQASHYGFDEKEYLAALDKVPRLSRQTIDRGKAFFIRLADMLSRESFSIIKLSRSVAQGEILADELRQSEERFRLALKNAPVAVAVQDRDLRFVWSYNPQSITPDDLVGKTDAEIFAPVDAAILAALKRKVLASGVELREQLWAVSNGKRMFLDLFLEPIHDAAGLITGVGVATVDYTQLKNTEEALQRMVKRFELLTDTASELLSTGEPQEIIESLCRRVMEHLDCHVFFNFLVDDHAGKLHLNACAGIPQAEAARMEWLDFGVAVCGCVAQEGCRIVAEHIPTTPDPRTDLVKSFGVKAYACHPLKSDGGAVIGTLSFGTRSRETFSNDDLYLMKAVTDRVATAMTRKRIEQELRNYNRMLKALSQSSQALTRVKNEADYLEEVCRIVVEDCGYALVWIGFAEDDEAKTVRPVASAGFEKEYLDALNISWADTERGRGPTGTAIRTGAIGMCRNMTVDPAFLPWRAQAAKHGFAASIVLPLMDGPKAFGALTIYSREVDPFAENEIRLLTELAGDLSSGIVTLRSSAARTKAEQALGMTAEELSRSNKDLEMFAYAASHDLQEPLRAVAGFMGILKKQYENKLDPEGREYLEYAVDGAERMQRLIHDLLTYSRVGTRGTAFRPSSAREALDAALYNLRLSIEESGAVVTCDSLPVITADRTQMTQVFQNLIGNALKFRGERTPAIAVSSKRENGSWVFRVEDNGIGIEPQYFDRIFIIFQRLHSREQYDGTGIGLAVVKKIIERHAGRIWVESTFGKGSTFYFSIPDRGAMNDYTEFPTGLNIAG